MRPLLLALPTAAAVTTIEAATYAARREPVTLTAPEPTATECRGTVIPIDELTATAATDIAAGDSLVSGAVLVPPPALVSSATAAVVAAAGAMVMGVLRDDGRFESWGTIGWGARVGGTV